MYSYYCTKEQCNKGNTFAPTRDTIGVFVFETSPDAYCKHFCFMHWAEMAWRNMSEV